MIYEQHIKDREEVTLYGGGYDKNLPPGARYGPVIRDVYVIECCTRGRGSVIINGEEFLLKAGDCFFLFPGDVVEHTADTAEPREGIWCTVEGLNIGTALKDGGITNKTPFAPPETFDKIYKSIERLISEKEETDMGSQFRHASYIYDILGALLETRHSNNKNTWIEEAISFVEANYFDRDLTAGTLARRIGLERTYFSSLFKAKTGISPYAYITSFRIKKVCALMKKTNVGIAEAAVAVGLDPLNFCAVFKREMGITPREYRKILSSDKSEATLKRNQSKRH